MRGYCIGAVYLKAVFSKCPTFEQEFYLSNYKFLTAIFMKFEFVENSSQEEVDYQRYHQRRFEFALKRALQYSNGRIVEVGPYAISYNLLKQGLAVEAIGFLSEKIKGINKFVAFDFEALRSTGKPLLSDNYNLVIACEVIEHLNLDIDLIYRQLFELTAPGGIVIIQTPNAVALKKRMTMLIGKNPFEMVRSDYTPGNGGHIREFTMAELKNHAVKNNFTVKEAYCLNYFDYSHSIKARLYRAFCNICPPGFRDGITIILQRK